MLDSQPTGTPGRSQGPGTYLGFLKFLHLNLPPARAYGHAGASLRSPTATWRPRQPPKEYQQTGQPCSWPRSAPFGYSAVCTLT